MPRLSVVQSAIAAEGGPCFPIWKLPIALLPTCEQAPPACRTIPEREPFSFDAIMSARISAVNEHGNAVVGDDGLMLSHRVRERRLAKHMTQGALAEAAGITQGAVSKIEKGDTRSLKGDTLMRLATALGEDADYIRTGRRSAEKGKKPHSLADDCLALFMRMPPSHQTTWLKIGEALLAQNVLHKEQPPRVVNDSVANDVLTHLSELFRKHGPHALARALSDIESAVEQQAKPRTTKRTKP